MTPGRKRRGLSVAASAAQDAIMEMTDDHLLCRDFGHSWRPYQVDRIAQRKQWQETLLCQRCHTVRRRLLDFRGGMLANGYTYPEGYLVQGVGRLTGSDRDGLRLAGLQAVMRVTGDPTQQRKDTA